MMQEYEDFAPKVDEINDLGSTYEAMVNPNDRPMSPIRKISQRECLCLLVSIMHFVTFRTGTSRQCVI
jgi:hypothetical protein